ncbi:MAG: cyclic nucleotide-binding domain-containing protein [Actinobacteria bacterium]|nr:cyclic nucleotide-binding domain-containing protein [Actinomycetota bacterium]
MSDAATVDFLAALPLFEGFDRAGLERLAGVVRRRRVRADQVLWRQGEGAREMFFVLDGAVAEILGLPGGRTREVGRASAGETLGEVELLDGVGHPTEARAASDATLLSLGRLGFTDLLAGQEASVFAFRRHLAELFTTRLRAELGLVSEALGGEIAGPTGDDAVHTFSELEERPAPDSAYVRRMASFHGVDPLALWGFLTSGRYVYCPQGRVLLAEGAPPPAYYLTINGAVEKVLVRGHRRVRVGLAGPGRAFGGEALIDGLPSPLTAVARERSLLLVIPAEIFERLFHGEDAVSRVFLEVVLRDLASVVREALRPYARVLLAT